MAGVTAAVAVTAAFGGALSVGPRMPGKTSCWRDALEAQSAVKKGCGGAAGDALGPTSGGRLPRSKATLAPSADPAPDKLRLVTRVPISLPFSPTDVANLSYLDDSRESLLEERERKKSRNSDLGATATAAATAAWKDSLNACSAQREEANANCGWKVRVDEFSLPAFLAEIKAMVTGLKREREAREAREAREGTSSAFDGADLKPSRLDSTTGASSTNLSDNPRADFSRGGADSAAGFNAGMHEELARAARADRVPHPLETLQALEICHIRSLREFPLEILALPNLRELTLTNSALKHLPTEISELQSLRVLRVSGNRLCSLPDSLALMANLEVLDASSNCLTTLPDVLPPKLFWLEVCDNEISCLPMVSLPPLQHLNVRSNQLQELPVELFRLPSLKVLVVSDNHLTRLPEGIATNAVESGLARLELCGNELHSLPAELGELPNLVQLDVSGNKLAKLPDTLWEAPRLDTVVAAANQLRKVSSEVAKALQLKYLDVSRNKLDGLPEALPATLETLRAVENEISAWPAELASFPSLLVLDLTSNKLREFPKELNAPRLVSLGVAHNRLTKLPEVLGRCSALQLVAAGHNQIKEVPESFGNLENLRWLRLDSNVLQKFPAPIYKLSSLQHLNLARNPLAKLPPCVSTLRELKSLDISYTRMESVPEEVVQLPHLSLLVACLPKMVKVAPPPKSAVESKKLGSMQLELALQDRVMLEKHNVCKNSAEIGIDAAVRAHQTKELFWDIRRLQSLQVRMPEKTYDEGGSRRIARLWDEILAARAPTLQDGAEIRSFVLTLFDLDVAAFQGWRVNASDKPGLRSLLGEVTERLAANEADAKALVPLICEAVRLCPDALQATLRQLYLMLYGLPKPRCLAEFVENELTVAKEMAFLSLATPAAAPQNVCTQNVWRVVMSKPLGFDDTGFYSALDLQDQHPVAHAGNFIKSFLSSFSPDHAVDYLHKRLLDPKNAEWHERAVRLLVRSNRSLKRIVERKKTVRDETDCRDRLCRTAVAALLELHLGFFKRRPSFMAALQYYGRRIFESFSKRCSGFTAAAWLPAGASMGSTRAARVAAPSRQLPHHRSKSLSSSVTSGTRSFCAHEKGPHGSDSPAKGLRRSSANSASICSSNVSAASVGESCRLSGVYQSISVDRTTDEINQQLMA